MPKALLTTDPLFAVQTIASGASIYVDIDCGNLGSNGMGKLISGGFNSLDITFTGAGSLTATAQYADGAVFDATNAVTIFSGQAAGRVQKDFGVMVTRAMRIVLSASGGDCALTKSALTMLAMN